MRQQLTRKFTVMFLLLQACAWGGSGSASLSSSWSEVLSILNQAPAAVDAEDRITFSHALDDDLLKINETEIQTIKNLWQPKEKNLKEQGLDKNAIRSQKLTYFHEKLQTLNKSSLTFLEQTAKPGTLTEKQAVAILADVRQHQVASLDQTRLLSRGEEIGFCFGRALLVHYFLLKAGIPQHQMAKIFTIGELKVANTLWHFHVAVLVNTESGYRVMDPLHPNPLPVQDWVKINEDYSIKTPWSQSRFYVTDSRKFMPGGGKYEESAMRHSAYQNYFQLLMASLSYEGP